MVKRLTLLIKGPPGHERGWCTSDFWTQRSLRRGRVAVFAPRTCDSAWRWNAIHRSWAHFLREGPPIWISYWKLPFISIEIVDLPIRNGDFPIRNGDFPIRNGDFPIKNGDFPIKNGDFPIKNGDFPMKNGDFPVSLCKRLPCRFTKRPFSALAGDGLALFSWGQNCVQKGDPRGLLERGQHQRGANGFPWLPAPGRYIMIHQHFVIAQNLEVYYGLLRYVLDSTAHWKISFQHFQFPEIFLKFPENSKLKMLLMDPSWESNSLLLQRSAEALRRIGLPEGHTWSVEEMGHPSGRWCCHQLG